MLPNISQSIKFEQSYLSSFGTIETGELDPIFQSDFIHGMNIQLWNSPIVNGTGALVDTNLGRLRVQGGTGGVGTYSYVQNKKFIRYRAGLGTLVRFTPVFSTGLASSMQLMGIGTISSNNPYDGYFLGYDGTTFGIFHYNGGVKTFYPKNEWNQDKLDGLAGSAFNYDPTKGTPVMIKYPFLAFGCIFFWFQNPENGEWVLAHIIQYANKYDTLQLSNPSLKFLAFISSSGNTNNLTIYTGSILIAISGKRTFVSNPKWAWDSTKTGITAETNLLSIKNCTSYNGVPNQGMIRLNFISFGSTTNQSAIFLIRIGATVGGTKVFNPINGNTSDDGNTITNGNSIASIDVGGTTVSGGLYEFNTSLGDAGTVVIDLTQLDIVIAPGEILTISAKSTNAALNVSVNWSEDI